MTTQQTKDAQIAANVFVRLAKTLRTTYKDNITPDELDEMARILVARTRKQEV
jgi:hypothetical protein